MLEHTEKKIEVIHAGTWYQTTPHILLGDNKRGVWLSSEHVGTSPTDILIIYNFEFDEFNHDKWRWYKGLLTGKIRSGVDSVFGAGPAYTGKFYVLDAERNYKGPKSGNMYIELYRTYAAHEFKFADAEDALKKDIGVRSGDIWKRLGGGGPNTKGTTSDVHPAHPSHVAPGPGTGR